MNSLLSPVAQVLGFVFALCGCTGSHRVEPRPANGCGSNAATAAPPGLIYQSAEDARSCIRLDLVREETSGGSEVPNVTVRGPFYFQGAWRLTGPCDDYDPTEIDFHYIFDPSPSATPLESAAGTVELRENALVRADLDLTFGEAPDGSLGPTSTTLLAEEVCLNAFCSEPPEPCPAP